MKKLFLLFSLIAVATLLALASAPAAAYDVETCIVFKSGEVVNLSELTGIQCDENAIAATNAAIFGAFFAPHYMNQNLAAFQGEMVILVGEDALPNADNNVLATQQGELVYKLVALMTAREIMMEEGWIPPITVECQTGDVVIANTRNEVVRVPISVFTPLFE